MAMTYGHVYVAQVAMGANKQQLLNAFIEAEKHNGPALIIAYSPCIAHGVDLRLCMEEEKRAVECGYWHLFRFNPALKAEGKSPLILDSKALNGDYQEFLMGENRFASLKKAQPQIAEGLFNEAEQHSQELFHFYQKLSEILGK
jgi:pyruvate-ferredoxin/flavodoxin oxidoreductase